MIMPIRGPGSYLTVAVLSRPSQTNTHHAVALGWTGRVDYKPVECASDCVFACDKLCSQPSVPLDVSGLDYNLRGRIGKYLGSRGRGVFRATNRSDAHGSKNPPSVPDRTRLGSIAWREPHCWAVWYIVGEDQPINDSKTQWTSARFACVQIFLSFECSKA
jgi:hypothetical protein